MGCQHSIPIPSEETLRQRHPSKGPYLGEDVTEPGALPSTKEPVEFVVKERALTSWSGDSFRVRTPQGGLYAGGVQIKSQVIVSRILARAMNPLKFTLLDGSGNDLAYATLTGHRKDRGLVIYGPKPCRQDQGPTTRINGREVYAWAKMDLREQDANYHYVWMPWTEQGYHSIRYKASPAGPQCTPTKSYAVLDRTRQGSPVVASFHAKRSPLKEFFVGNIFHVTVAPGIDPLLMLCFVAGMDILFEFGK